MTGIRAAPATTSTRVIGQFADAAARARAAGFDGVEIHGAHGYLFTQFLERHPESPDDEWGGSLDNRARLVRETMRAVRARVGAFTVGVRLSPEDFGNARGLDLDESVQTARWLADDGADFIHLSLWHSLANTAKRPDAHAIPLFRAALPSDVRILAAGSVWTRGEAEEVLSKGRRRRRARAVGRHQRRLAAARRGSEWIPRRPPVTIDWLRAGGLSPTFAEYMRRSRFRRIETAGRLTVTIPDLPKAWPRARPRAARQNTDSYRRTRLAASRGLT